MFGRIKRRILELEREEGRQEILDWFRRKQEAEAQGIPFEEPIPGDDTCIPDTNEPQDLPQDLPDKNGTGSEDLKTPI